MNAAARFPCVQMPPVRSLVLDDDSVTNEPNKEKRGSFVILFANMIVNMNIQVVSK